LLIDDADAARRIVALLRAQRDTARETHNDSEGGIAAALDGCRAVVVVPRGERAAFDQLVSSPSAPPSAALDGVGR
jgi:hypothetical protein